MEVIHEIATELGVDKAAGTMTDELLLSIVKHIIGYNSTHTFDTASDKADSRLAQFAINPNKFTDR
jgi:hypothetical protein